VIDTEFDNNGTPEKFFVLAGDFLNRFTTRLLMDQGRVVADKVRGAATFRNGTGELRDSIVAMPLKRNTGIKITSRHNGRYLPHASPQGTGIDIVPRNGKEFMTFQSRTGQWVKLKRFTYGPMLNIRGPFRETFGGGKGFRIVEERMTERIREMVSK